MIKNIDVLLMVNLGMLDITNNDLDVKDAYKIVKFRTALNKALEKIQEIENTILKDCNIKDPKAFDADIERLQKIENRTEYEEDELEELLAKSKKYNSTRAAMLNDDAVLENVSTISYESWYKLRKENRPKKDGDKDPLNNYVESILENVLWVAPED